MHPDRLKANIDVFSWEIPTEEFEMLSSLKTQNRMVAGAFIINPLGPYKSLDELWDD